MDKKEKIFVRKFHGKFGYAIRNYQLIQDGDKILVGVSGGKDSLCLLQCLANRRKYSKEKYQIEAVFVDIQEVPYKIDQNYLKQFCNNLGVKLHIIKKKINIENRPKKSLCFYCSWHRRKIMFSLRKDLNCNKLALGHHADDALETLLLNMVFHGTISSLPAKLNMFDGDMQLIRPLIDFQEADIIEYSRIFDYPLNNIACPYEDKTQRLKAKKLVEQIVKIFPNSRKNMMEAMRNIYIEYLPLQDGKTGIIPFAEESDNLL
jgi:tRNA 2-thiocytidine biosynthesis protein TtcA